MQNHALPLVLMFSYFTLFNLLHWMCIHLFQRSQQLLFPWPKQVFTVSAIVNDKLKLLQNYLYVINVISVSVSNDETFIKLHHFRQTNRRLCPYLLCFICHTYDQQQLQIDS